MVETEQALIGAILGNPEIMPEIVQIVRPEDFTDTNAVLAFAEVSSLFSQDKPIDIVTVSASGRVSLQDLAEAGGVGYWSHAEEYAATVAKNAKSIRLRRGLRELRMNEDPKDILSGISTLYDQEVAVDAKSPDMQSVMARFDAHIRENRQRGSLGLNTGISLLNDNMVYYVPGQMWTVGGYTSTGKTAMMTQKIVNIFKANESPRVVVVSTEMTEEQMVARILGNMCGIYSQKILAGQLNPNEEEIYARMYRTLLSWDLKIHDDIYELSDIEAVARKHQMQGGFDVMFIDYVQNCKVKGVSESYAEQRILATALQQLAKKTDSTMICLSQVSNSVGRGDVSTFELKGAGEWAAVTDVGVMLTRGKIKDTELLYSIPKNRHGAKSSVVFEYKNNFSRLIETEEVVG